MRADNPSPALRIFTYQPNPRIWKATIAARLCGVAVEVRGAAPGELANWLWDFDARPLRAAELNDASHPARRESRVGFNAPLYKTDAFLDSVPFGTVPAAFSPDGTTGIFESNSIMRAVARLGEDTYPLYGSDPYQAASIDGFLDASLVFARDGQLYLLSLRSGTVDQAVQNSARVALMAYLAGIDRALIDATNGDTAREYLVGNHLSMADICFVAELASFTREHFNHQALSAAGLEPVLDDSVREQFPCAFAHYRKLAELPAFVPDLATFEEKLNATRAA